MSLKVKKKEKNMQLVFARQNKVNNSVRKTIAGVENDRAYGQVLSTLESGGRRLRAEEGRTGEVDNDKQNLSIYLSIKRFIS